MSNKIHEFCHNCMEEIKKEPIMFEVDRNIPGYEGVVSERDLVEDIILFCCLECKNEYFKPVEIKI